MVNKQQKKENKNQKNYHHFPDTKSIQEKRRLQYEKEIKSS